MRDPWMTVEDVYEVLGISDSASREDIKKAFALALKRMPAEEARRARQALLDDRQKMLVDILRYDNRFISFLGQDFCEMDVFFEDALSAAISEYSRHVSWRGYLKEREADAKWHIEAVHSLAVAFFWSGMAALRGDLDEEEEDVFSFASSCFDESLARFSYLLRSRLFWDKWKGEEKEKLLPEDVREGEHPFLAGEAGFLSLFREYALNLIFKEADEWLDEEAMDVYYSAAAALKAGEKLYNPQSFNFVKDRSFCTLSLGRGIIIPWAREGEEDFFLTPRFYLAKIEALLADGHGLLAKREMEKLEFFDLVREEEEKLEELCLHAELALIEENIKDGDGFEALAMLAKVVKKGGEGIREKVERLLVKTFPLLGAESPEELIDLAQEFLEAAEGKGEASRMLAEFAAARLDKACKKEADAAYKSKEFEPAVKFLEQAVCWLEGLREKSGNNSYVAGICRKWKEEILYMEILRAMLWCAEGRAREALALLRKRLPEAEEGTEVREEIVKGIIRCYLSMAEQKVMLEHDVDGAISILREGVKVTGHPDLKGALAAVLNQKALYLLEENRFVMRENPEAAKRVLQTAQRLLGEALYLAPDNPVIEDNYQDVDRALKSLQQMEERPGCLKDLDSFLAKIAIGYLILLFLGYLAGC